MYMAINELPCFNDLDVKRIKQDVFHCNFEATNCESCLFHTYTNKCFFSLVADIESPKKNITK